MSTIVLQFWTNSGVARQAKSTKTIAGSISRSRGGGETLQTLRIGIARFGMVYDGVSRTLCGWKRGQKLTAYRSGRCESLLAEVSTCAAAYVIATSKMPRGLMTFRLHPM